MKWEVWTRRKSGDRVHGPEDLDVDVIEVTGLEPEHGAKTAAANYFMSRPMVDEVSVDCHEPVRAFTRREVLAPETLPENQPTGAVCARPELYPREGLQGPETPRTNPRRQKALPHDADPDYTPAESKLGWQGRKPLSG